jgi:hypothetical protein
VAYGRVLALALQNVGGERMAWTVDEVRCEPGMGRLEFSVEHYNLSVKR